MRTIGIRVATLDTKTSGITFHTGFRTIGCQGASHLHRVITKIQRSIATIGWAIGIGLTRFLGYAIAATQVSFAEAGAHLTLVVDIFSSRIASNRRIVETRSFVRTEGLGAIQRNGTGARQIVFAHIKGTTVVGTAIDVLVAGRRTIIHADTVGQIAAVGRAIYIAGARFPGKKTGLSDFGAKIVRTIDVSITGIPDHRVATITPLTPTIAIVETGRAQAFSQNQFTFLVGALPRIQAGLQSTATHFIITGLRRTVSL